MHIRGLIPRNFAELAEAVPIEGIPWVENMCSNTCENDHSKIDKTKSLMTNGSLKKVESIAECTPWKWGALCNAFDLH